MELTGSRLRSGLKVQGPNVDGIEQLAAQMQSILSGDAAGALIFAERSRKASTSTSK